MPSYRITDEQTGKQYEIQGDRPPTQQELEQLFGSVQQSTTQPQQVQKPEQYSAALEGLRTALSGATGTYFDELKAVEEAIKTRQEGEEFGDAYNRSLEDIRSRQKFFQQENPNLATGLEIAGSIVPGVAAGTRFLGGKAFENLSNIEKLGRISGAGAVGGAIYGSGSAEGGLEDRLSKGVTGAATGAVAAPLGAGAVNLIGKGVGAGSQYVGRKLFDTPESQANRIMRRTLEDEGLTVDDVVTRMRELGPQATIADVGDAFRTQGRAALDTEAAGKTSVRKMLDARQQTQRARIKEQIEKTFGKDASTYFQEIDTIIKNRADEAAPLYDRAFAEGVQMNTAIGKFIQDEELSGLYAEAVRRAKSMGESGNLLQILNRLKIKIDDKVSSNIRKGEPGEARFWQGKKNELLGLIEEQNSTYGQALKTYSDASKFKDALEFGGQFLKKNPDELKIILSDLNEAEMEAFRLGAVKNLQDFLDRQYDNTDAVRRLLGTKQMRDRLALIMPDPEGFLRRMAAETEFTATNRQTLGGPNTAERLAAQDRLREDIDPGLLSFVGSLDPVTAIPQVARVLAKGKPSPELIEKLTGQLYEQGLSEDQVRRIFRSPLVRDAVGRIDYDRMIAPIVRGSAATATMPLASDG